jgi:hypothetical protein
MEHGTDEWAAWASRFTAAVPSLASSLAHAPSPRAAVPRGDAAPSGHETRQRLRGVDMPPKAGAVTDFAPTPYNQADAMVAPSTSSSEQTPERHGLPVEEQRRRTEEAVALEVPPQQAERPLSPDLVYPDSPHPSAGEALEAEEPFASSDQPPQSDEVRETPRGSYTS